MPKHMSIYFLHAQHHCLFGKQSMQKPICNGRYVPGSISYARLQQYQKKNDITHLIPRLLLSSTVYFVWHERNNCVFNNTFQSPQSIAEAIFQHVRLHIITMEHKDRIPIAVENVWGFRQSSQRQVQPAS